MSLIYSKTTCGTKIHNMSFFSYGCRQWSLGGQGCGSIKDLPRPFFLKSTLFTNSGHGKPLITPRPFLPGILMSIIRAFKWGIICFFTFIGSHLIWRKPKLMFKAVHSNPSPLYIMTNRPHVSEFGPQKIMKVTNFQKILNHCY